MTNHTQTRIAEYELDGKLYAVVHRLDEASAREAVTHFRFGDGTGTGLYRALSQCGPEPKARELLAWLEANAQAVAPPQATQPIRYRIPFHPVSVTYGMVSGFGLAHRNKLPADKIDATGRAAGNPAWFFKGFTDTLKANGEALKLTEVAQTVCEEAEIVLVFYVDSDKRAHYLGFTFGNDFTDIGQIRQNPSHLSYGKLADSAIHPFLYFGEPPERADGLVSITRQGETVWSGGITNGSTVLAYDVGTMMSKLWLHHALLVPGMMHYVYIGADRNSIDHGCRIESGDVVDIHFESFGARLSNPVHLNKAA